MQFYNTELSMLASHRRVFAAQLRRNGTQTLVVALNSQLARPGTLQVIPHIDAKTPQALSLQLDDLAMLKRIQSAVVRSRPGRPLRPAERGLPLHGCIPAVRRGRRAERLLAL